MAGRGRGTSLTRPAWMQTPRHPAPSSTTQPPPTLPSAPAPAAPPAAALAAAPTPAVADDWARAVSADGRPYWYSRATGATTWIDPSTTAAAAASQPAVQDAGSTENATPATTRPHLVTRASDVAVRHGAASAHSAAWRQVTTDDGRMYFYNRLTKRTQWRRPPDMPAISSVDVNTASLSIAAAAVGADATPARDDAAMAVAHSPADHGVTNKRANAPAQRVVDGADETPLPDGWARQRAPDGRVYYYHAHTRQTRWKPPDASTATELATAAAAAGGSEAWDLRTRGAKRPLSPSVTADNPAAADAAVDAVLPDGWRKHTAPDGRIYYYHAQTRKTSWTVPSTTATNATVPQHEARDEAQSPDRKRLRAQSPSESDDATPGKKGAGTVSVRRPRDADAKPLTDKAAEAYFIKRAALRKAAGVDEEGDDDDGDGKADVEMNDPGASFKHRTDVFYGMLREHAVVLDMPWLTVMSRCAGDCRYTLLPTYGARRDAWLKFRQRLESDARRASIVEARLRAEGLVALCEEVFKDEAPDVAVLNRCTPESVKRFQDDDKLAAIPERDRANIVDAFFAARVRKFAEERVRKKREVMQRMGEALETRIVPSLRGEKAVEEKENDAMDDGQVEKEPIPADVVYFTERTQFRELERFLMGVEGHEIVNQDDVGDVIRRWRRKVDTLWEERQKERKGIQKENRNRFRNGVLKMLLKGSVAFTARWKEVAEVVAKEAFAKPEEELGARPGDLYEYGLRMFEDRVQKHRDGFKRLVKEAGVEIDQSTTVENLAAVAAIKQFTEGVEPSVVKALLVDRQRKEHRRRMKERDRLMGEFRDMVAASEVMLGMTFEAAGEAWKELTLYKQLVVLGAEQEMHRVFDECMRVRQGKEQQRLKRRGDVGVAGVDGVQAGGQRAKRARMSGVVLGNGPFGRQAAMPLAREEDSGWAAAVKQNETMTEEEKLAEKERLKREILESLDTEKSLAHSQV